MKKIANKLYIIVNIIYLFLGCSSQGSFIELEYNNVRTPPVTKGFDIITLRLENGTKYIVKVDNNGKITQYFNNKDVSNLNVKSLKMFSQYIILYNAVSNFSKIYNQSIVYEIVHFNKFEEKQRKDSINKFVDYLINNDESIYLNMKLKKYIINNKFPEFAPNVKVKLNVSDLEK